MNDMVTTLTKRGQTSIPASIRRKVGLRPGHSLRWDFLSDSEMRVRVEPAGSPAGAFAALGYAKRWLPEGTAASTDAILSELRAGEDA